MEGSSSSSKPRIPENIPINTISKKSCFTKNKTINIDYDDFELVMEQPVDFEALKANGYDVKEFFKNQGWLKYFDMLNGPVYPVLVKDFWPRCEVIEQVDADREYKNKVAEDPENKGKSRTDLGLREFKETEIRSGVTGFEVILTQSNIAQVLKLPNQGVFKTFTHASGRKSPYVSRIAKNCYIDEDSIPSNKVKDMKETERLLARIICLHLQSPMQEYKVCSESIEANSSDCLPQAAKKMNLAAYIFNHLCKSIRSAQNPLKLTPQIAYPRLLSEVFYQCAVTDRIERARTLDLLEEQRAFFINGSTLVNMKLAGSKTLKYPTQPLLESKKKTPIPENQPYLFSNEPPEVILEYIRFMKEQASGAEASKAKSTDDKKTIETAATKDVGASEVKETDKGKRPEATASEVKPVVEKAKVTKKPR
ncbi:hypothetical protein A2U01_0006683, partial [Trifolium medium]|nr:hypothetical protein [Trifolium medium]